MTTPPLTDPRFLKSLIGSPAPIDTINAPALTSSIAAPDTSVPSLGSSMTQPVVSAFPTQTQTDMTERNRRINSGDGISQIHNPLLKGIARAADIAGSVFAPNLAMAIPGTSLHHNMLVNQATRNVVADQAQEKATADVADSQAQTQQRQAQTEAIANPQKAIDPSKTVQTDDGVFQLNPQTGKYDQRVGDRVEKPKTPEQAAYEAALGQGMKPLEAFTALNQAKNTKDASFQQQFLDAYTKAHPEVPMTDAIAATIRATSTQPKIDVHNEATPAGGTGTWQMVMDKDNNPKFFNTKTGEIRDNATGITKGKGDRATVDEQKRADLAKNMNENLDAMEDILTRRPELFGPIAGRMTDAKAGFGTDDPDIARMINIKHQLGMVAQGTHGMRSAQGIESAANSLLGGFHNSPAATKAALESARTSAGTFLDDANHPGQSRGGESSSGPKVGDVVDGYKFKGGNAADQKNWVKQ